MLTETNHLSYRIAGRAVNQGACTLMENQVGFDKLATGPNDEIRLLKCRQISKIATFNVRTLKHTMKLSELTYLVEKYEIDVICVQEHRIYHDDINIKYQEVSKGWKRQKIILLLEELDY